MFIKSDWSGVFFLPPHIFPLRCLASGTRSEALIWLPVRQQPFNNNAIVPHSSSPVSLIHPAVCRWYIVCDLRKHSSFWDVFPFCTSHSPPTRYLTPILTETTHFSFSVHTVVFHNRSAEVAAPQRWSESVRTSVCVCVVSGKFLVCVLKPPAVGDIWRRRYHEHREKRSSGLKYHPPRTTGFH